MNKPFMRIVNLDEHRQVQVFTDPCDAVNIIGYTITKDNSFIDRAGISLSPEAARSILNILKE